MTRHGNEKRDYIILNILALRFKNGLWWITKNAENISQEKEELAAGCLALVPC